MKRAVPIMVALMISACGVRDGVSVPQPEDSGPVDAGMDLEPQPQDSDRPDMPVVTDMPPDPDATPDPDMTSDPDMRPDPDMPPGPITFALGDGEPFQAWTDGGDLPVVAGMQGGYHTEHLGRVAGTVTQAELDEAELSLTVETADGVIAEGVWIFFDTQWAPDDADGWVTTIPPVIHQDGAPHYGEQATVTGTVELPDGRTETFSVDVTLVERQ